MGRWEVMIPTLSTAQTGLWRASSEMLSAAERLSRPIPEAPVDGEVSLAEASQDLTRGVLDLARARTLYNANAAVIAVASEVSGKLLDVLESRGR